MHAVRKRFVPSFLFLAFLFVTKQLSGQVISGSLRDSATDESLPSATVTLLREDGIPVQSVTTDQMGAFRFMLSGSGRYQLRAERIGYATATSEVLLIESADLVEVNLGLSTEAIEVAPINVSVATRPWWEIERPEEVWEFYERLDRFGRYGFGRFLTTEDIERQRQAPAWVILSNQLAFGIRLESSRRGPMERSITIDGCRPVYFLDGLPFRADDLAIFNTIEDLAQEGQLEGIETYSKKWHIPTAFYVFLTSRDCGAVVAIWTKEP